MGTRTHKRGDRGRRRTVGRIERGGGDGGEPVRSPQGRLELFAGRVFIQACREMAQLGTPLFISLYFLHY